MTNVRISYNVDKSQVDAAEKSLEDLNKTTDISQKEADQLSAKFKEANSSASKVKRGVNDVNGELGKFNKVATQGKQLLVGFFAAQSITAFAKDVARVTGEFQKFQAVLTNTLGSSSKAKKALDDITKFASVTPFSVQQLTASFVKLANQGFIPTTNELRKLGDLSASVGKDFDQLTEAVIDAQVGEFERLKEFGIRAAKEGDNVTFTFKGIQTQTEFTNEAIRKYILSLGDLQGVSGSMAAISETLNGRLSNLGDTYDQFLLRVGQSTSGAAFEAIGFLNELILGVTTFATRLELIKLSLNPFKDLSDASEEALNDILKLGETDTGKKVAELTKNFDSLADNDFFNDLTKFKKEFIDLFVAEGESAEDADALFKQYYKNRREGRESLNDIIAAGIKIQEEEAKQAAKNSEAVALATQKLLEGFEKLKAADPSKESNARIKEAQNLLNIVFGQQTDYFKTAKDRLAESVKTATDGEAEITRQKKKESDKRIKIDEEEQRRREDLVTASINLGLNAADALTGIAVNRIQREINEIEKQKNYELNLEGRTEEEKKAIQDRFDAQITEKRREQARKEKSLALFNIAVQTAENAVRLFALTIPPGILSAVAVGVGALQAGVVASQPLPFNKGTKRVPGHNTSKDSVPAILTPGEGVMPVDRMNAYRPAFEAIFDRKIKPEVLNSFVKNGGSQVVVNNDMSQVAKAIKGQPKSILKVDKDGFTMHQILEGQRLEKKLSRYR